MNNNNVVCILIRNRKHQGTVDSDLTDRNATNGAALTFIPTFHVLDGAVRDHDNPA